MADRKRARELAKDFVERICFFCGSLRLYS